MEKLMKDLEFLDQPLAPKRIKKINKNESEVQKQEFDVCVEENENMQQESEVVLTISEEEQRRRKNKEQVAILLNEYVKNPNWDRDYMK